MDPIVARRLRRSRTGRFPPPPVQAFDETEGKTEAMSMSDPLLPHSSHDDDRTVAAEPGGEGAPLPQADEEPDVLTGADENAGSDARPREDPPFRTPVAGDSLTPDQLAAEIED